MTPAERTAATVLDFRAIAETIPELVWTALPGGVIDYVNEQICAYAGLTRESHGAWRWEDVAHPDDLAKLLAAWRRAVGDGEPFEAESRLRRADGAYRWFIVRASAMREPDGAVTRWFGTCTDIDHMHAAAARDAFLARLGEAVAKTLDVHETLDAATGLLAPQYADWALVNLIDDNGALFLAASHHRDPERDAALRELLEMRYISGDARAGSAAVVRAKRPVVYEDFPANGLGAAAAPYRDAIDALRITSAIIVPIEFAGAVRGTLAVAYDGTSRRRYSADDLPLIVEVARRLSPAIGNAEAYERERRVARTFQAAALTTELPRIAGVSFDALYEAGRSEALIGGDWYDAFRVADGRVVMSVGDVAGSGLEAAATMAAIRQSLRGAAAINPDPSVMLDAADRVLRSQVPDRFVTAWVGVLDPVWATLACAGAGHPAPLCRTARAEIVRLPAEGLPLGLRERGADITSHLDLDQDETLLLYTDGLIEAGRDVIAGERALVDALREADADNAPAQAIHEGVLRGAGASDDVALLVVAFRRSLLDIGGDYGAPRWTFDVADSEAAAAARAAIVDALERRGIAEVDRTFSELVFAELIGNVKRYAPGAIEVALDLSDEYAVLHVVDTGAGFQHNARLPTDALAENGRGLFIVSTIAEEFTVTRGPTGGAHAPRRPERPALVTSVTSYLWRSLIANGIAYNRKSPCRPRYEHRKRP